MRRGGQEDERDNRAVDHAEGEEMVNNTAYPEPNYRRPHSRRCSCNRISWMALNTTGGSEASEEEYHAEGT